MLQGYHTSNLDSAITWSNPDISLLNGGNQSRPSFPAQMLGEFWAGWAPSVAAGKNAPVDYVGASLITLAAALIGNARTVDAGGWTEPSVLWTVLVGNPSAGKSPAMDPFIEMIAAFEAEAADETAEHEDVAGTIHIDDVTAPAAAEVAACNPRGLILTKDELSHWWSRFGQTGGEAFWLKAFGGRPESVKRKGKRPLHIKRLAINVLGGAQPTTLDQFIAGKENKGFAARWLYVFPVPVRGFRIAKPVEMAFAQAALRRLWRLQLEDGKPLALPVAQQALGRFEAWVNEKRQAAEADEDGVWGQWLGKQGGIALRLALVFEHLWWAAKPSSNPNGPTKISGRALTAAMRFIDDYAAPMAALTLANASCPVEDQDALRLIRMLTKKGDAQFNARLLRRGVSHGPVGRLAKPAVMSAACDVLIAAKLIRHIGERVDGKPGRRPSLFEVNPALMSRLEPKVSLRRRAAA